MGRRIRFASALANGQAWVTASGTVVHGLNWLVLYFLQIMPGSGRCHSPLGTVAQSTSRDATSSPASGMRPLPCELCARAADAEDGAIR
ncbi:hypothetical protein UB46_25415 [Burkholderiaceae bacterium 16]|nr:hypothetical protein UB46_25415 [Burkholderiaceae bacterium 16]